VAKPELGTKRQCQNCSTKFYDLMKDPILCPKCGTAFVVSALRSRAAAVAARAADNDELDVEPAAAVADFVPLEEADVVDDSKVVVDVDVDVDVDEDLGGADETFLEAEEDEGDDDVADLIDGDIETDEES
jgi:uncharacterized protein (TIGR02300 family)